MVWRLGSIEQNIRRIDKKKLLLWILLIAVVSRLLFIVLFSDVVEGELLDSTRYQRVALYLIAGRGFTEYGRNPTVSLPPMYPFFLAGIFKVFGHHVIVVKIIQAILGTLVCWVVYRMGIQLFGVNVGLVGALLTALYPDLIALTGYLYTETLYIFISSLALLYILKGFSEDKGKKSWIIGGGLMGLGALTRHFLFVFPVFLLILVLIWKVTRKHVKNILILMVACYVVVCPWIVRNYICFGKFIPVAAGVGGSFWIGSYTPHQGEYRYKESDEKIKEEVKGVEDVIEKDNILIKNALKRILDDPLDYMYLFVKKFLRYFLQVYQDIPNGRARGFNVLVMLVSAFSYYPIFLLFLIGTFLLRTRLKEFLPLYGIIVYSGVLYSMMIVVPRYRMPLLPFFILFAAFGLVALGEKLHSWRSRRDTVSVNSLDGQGVEECR